MPKDPLYADELELQQEATSEQLLTALDLHGHNHEQWLLITIDLNRGESHDKLLQLIKMRFDRAGLGALRYAGVRVHRNRKGRLMPHIHIVVSAPAGSLQETVLKSALEVIKAGGRSGTRRKHKSVDCRRCQSEKGSMTNLAHYLGENVKDLRDRVLMDGKTASAVRRLLSEDVAEGFDWAAEGLDHPIPLLPGIHPASPGDALLAPDWLPLIPAPVASGFSRFLSKIGLARLAS